MDPPGEDAQSSGDARRTNTDWTLTDDAIVNGIQSTTRYRNKKSVKKSSANNGEARRGQKSRLPATSAYGAASSDRQAAASRGYGPQHGRHHPGRVCKVNRHGGRYVCPTPEYVGRALSSGGYYHGQDTTMAVAHATAAGQGLSIKADPDLSPSYPPPPMLADGPVPYGAPMAVHQGIMMGGSGLSLGGVPGQQHGGGGCGGGTQAFSPVYLGPGDRAATSNPPSPPSHHVVQLPFGSADVNLGYPTTSERGAAAGLFDATNDMQHDFFDLYNTHHEY